MFREPSILLRPFEPDDAYTIQQWRECCEWPRASHSTFSVVQQNAQNACLDKKVHSEDIILVAESASSKPIGLAHLSKCEPSSGSAQYSVAIPDPRERTFGRARDLLLLSIGSAFYIYGFSHIVSLVDRHNLKLVRACLKGGFQIAAEARVPASQQVLIATPESWMPIWGPELAYKGERMPWFDQNAAWTKIRSANAACGLSGGYRRASRPVARIGVETSCPYGTDITNLTGIPPQKVLG